MPVVHWPRLGWWRWLLSGVMALWIFGLWGISQESGRDWVGQLYLLLLPFQIHATFGRVRLISGGVLTISRSFSVVHRVPLARAELQRKGSQIRIRWRNGKIGNTETLRATPAFADALETSVQSARSAAPGSMPLTEAEAARMVTLAPLAVRNPWVAGSLGALLGLLMVAIWLNQPLFLLPLALLPLAAERGFAQGWLMLSGEELWLLRGGMEPSSLPLVGAQVVEAGRRRVSLRTTDPAYGELRLDSRVAADLLREVGRVLRGEPRPAFSVDEESPPAAVARCSICGRPLEGAAEAVPICEQCAARARYEAGETGHGLASKEARPL